MASNPKLLELTHYDMDHGEEASFGPGTEVTLRDLFAAICAAGIEASGLTPSKTLAEMAYEDADALLAKREADDDN